MPTSAADDQEKSQDDDTRDGGGGISRGAVAGIVVGVGVFIMLICAAAFFWYRKRHMKSQKQTPEDAFDSEKSGGIQEMEVPNRFQGPSPAMETDATFDSFQRQSSHGTFMRDSVQSGTVASELDGSTGERHELVGVHYQAKADIVELQDASPNLTPEPILESLLEQEEHNPESRPEPAQKSDPVPQEGPGGATQQESGLTSGVASGLGQEVSQVPTSERMEEASSAPRNSKTGSGSGYQVRRKPVSG